jgi:hypothetical protein
MNIERMPEWLSHTLEIDMFSDFLGKFLYMGTYGIDKLLRHIIMKIEHFFMVGVLHTKPHYDTQQNMEQAPSI